MHAQDYDLIPAAAEVEELMAQQTAVASAPAAPLNVLVIDDEKAVRDGCRHAADGLGFKTFVAENAGNAYKTLETQDIDVVLLDMKLPGSSSGLSMLNDIRSR